MNLFKSSRFSERVVELKEKWRVPGVTVAIVQDDAIASKAFGSAQLHPSKPCTADTIFDIGSCSKSLTAASVGLLVADNDNYPDVQWDTPMSVLLPEDFAMAKDDYTRGVTVEDIIRHRTGVPAHDASYLGVRSQYPDSAQSTTRNLRNLGISCPIRTKFMYSNMNYTVASYLVEKISGQSFGAFLHERFFKPLGMNSTCLQPNSAFDAGLEDRMAMPYIWEEENGEFRALEYVQSPEAQGAGSIISSATDYVKWVKAMLSKSAFITEDVYRGLVRPRIIMDPDAILDPYSSWPAYAAGWEIRFYRGYEIIEHDGLTSGFSSSHFFIPSFNFGAVIMCNVGEDGEFVALLRKSIIDEVVGVTQEHKLKNESLVEVGNSPHCLGEPLWKKLCPEIDAPQPQTKPLGSYMGKYHNAGYHTLTMVARGDQLFIDASDRSNGFYLTFQHICNQAMYVALDTSYSEGDVLERTVEFIFNDDDKVVKMGIDLEQDLGNLIWFDKIKDSSQEESLSERRP